MDDDDGPPELVVVGSISSDRLRTPSSSLVSVPGGAGLYASLGAAVAGTRVGLVGLVSEDVDAALMSVLSRRVDDAGVVRVHGRRLRFDITYDESWRADYVVDGADAEELIGFHLVPESYLPAQGFHLCPTGSPGAQLAMARALRGDSRTAGATLSATTFRNRIIAEPHTVRRLWSMVDMLVCNAEEAGLLTGQTRLVATLQHLAGRLDDLGGTVYVTLDARGGYVVTAERTLAVAAYPVRVIDPTGAGESFAGAVLAARLSGADPVRAAVTGMAVASIVTEGFGPAALLAADPGAVRRRAAVVTAMTRAGVRGG